MIQILKYTVVILLLSILSCQDVLDLDISNESVTLIAPGNGLVTDVQQHNFTWNEIDATSRYRLQIVQPKFSDIQFFIMDTVVVSQHFQTTLQDGDYEWTVAGINDNYESSGDTFSLVITTDTASVLSNQMIQLVAPENGICINENTMNFSWSSLTNADVYNFQISHSIDFSTILDQENITENQLAYTFESEGTYYWQVRAENNATLSVTNWKVAIINLDFTAPAIPQIIGPNPGSTIILSLQDPDLIWTVDNESLVDSVFIYADPLADTLIYAIKTEVTGINLDTTVISNQSTLIEDYYWKVQSFDKAGNSSSSGLSPFFVQ